MIDIASIAYDIYDIQQNGLNWTNGLSLAADVGSLALPVMTGGGMMVRTAIHADDAVDTVSFGKGTFKAAREALERGDDTLLKELPDWAQPMIRGQAFSLRLLDQLGSSKNTKKIQGFVDDAKVNTIPDYLDDVTKRIGEINDVAQLSGTKQIRAQLAWAREMADQGWTYTIHTRNSLPDENISSWLLELARNETWFDIIRDIP